MIKKHPLGDGEWNKHAAKAARCILTRHDPDAVSVTGYDYDDYDDIVDAVNAVAADTTNWQQEREDILRRFIVELAKATKDGSVKRQRGEKPVWYEDESHHDAGLRHYQCWLAGETQDEDSGASPLVHAAWRLLALACIETGNVPYPLPDGSRNKGQG